MSKELPFELGPKDELLQSLIGLENAMETQSLGMVDWLKRVVEKNEPWRIAPETDFMSHLARLYLFETEQTLLPEGKTKNQVVGEELSGLVESIEKASASIGRPKGDFFKVDMQIISMPEKGVSYPAPLLNEEPGYTEQYRERHPIGIIILPYFVDENGEYYIYPVIRNEPGALYHSVVAAGEQTSLTKMVGADVLNQPGGPVLAVCAQEMGAINCEGVPELREILPEINHIIAYPNTNRMSGGFKLYATAKLEQGSSLFDRYKGKWYKLEDLIDLLEENKTKKPIINELLGNCLFVLQTERVKELQEKVAQLEKRSL
ncbi:hypothetical protein ACFL1Q_01475 [Patescibacteria group bacterium]